MPRLVVDSQERVRDTMFVGIDPGANGGVAAILPNGTTVAKMPDSELELWEHIRALKILADYNELMIIAVVEHVTGYVGNYNRSAKRESGEDETAGNTGASMFKFGTSYGAVCMALVALGISTEYVQAAVWQRALGLRRPKGTAPRQWKRVLRDEAKRLHPELRVTLKTADALLLAEFAKRKYGGVTCRR